MRRIGSLIGMQSLVRGLPAAAAIVVVPLLSLATPNWFGPVAAAAIWGLGLIACFCGWGTWAAGRLAPALDVDLGLRAAWGLALTVVAGGLLCLLGLGRRPVLIAWTFAGIALAARDAAVTIGRAFRVAADGPASPRVTSTASHRRFNAEILVVAGLLGLVAFTYLAAAARGNPNPSDDLVAYLPFVRKLLQTGTFLDPFSVRRMAAYGGQTYLQALTLLGAEDGQIQLFDQGICLVLLAGLMLCCRRQVPRPALILISLVLLVLVMLPEVRINSASEVSGGLAFLAVWRTLGAVQKSSARSWRSALLVALPLATVCTLRQNFMVVAAIMGGSLLLPDGNPLAARSRYTLRVGLLVAACLAPWAALAFRSNHTFLFPFLPGNYDPHYAGLTGTATWDARVRFYLSMIFQDDPIRAMPLFMLAAPAVARLAKQPALLGLWLGTIVGFALVALSLPEADSFTVARYGFASEVALVLAIGIGTASLAAQGWAHPPAPDRDARRARMGIATALVVVVALGLQVHGTQAATVRNLSIGLDRLAASHADPPPLATSAPQVRNMQAAIPGGARTLVMIERPYLLDFSRNPIALLDLPGAASPRRALPLSSGPEAMAAYLVAEGYRYLAFTVPDAAENDLYKRQHWKKALLGRQKIWRDAAPVYLATFDALDHFGRTRASLYDDGHLRVVDLATTR
jgi:hypothetical protein